MYSNITHRYILVVSASQESIIHKSCAVSLFFCMCSLFLRPFAYDFELKEDEKQVEVACSFRGWN